MPQSPQGKYIHVTFIEDRKLVNNFEKLKIVNLWHFCSKQMTGTINSLEKCCYQLIFC